MHKSQETCDGVMPLSGMNWAAWREAIPAFLLLPNFNISDDKFSRHDDIWGGYIFQKIVHKMDCRLTFGSPVVFHDTIVDAKADADEEVAMIKYEKTFLDLVDETMDNVYRFYPEGVSYKSLFEDFNNKWTNGMFPELREPLQFWVDLFADNVKKQSELDM